MFIEMFTIDIINRFKSLKTPFYYYDLDLLHETLTELSRITDSYNYKVHYAIKANANDKILKTIQSYGLGADCVSGNEVRKAVETGFKPEDIVFAGVGKTDDEILYALENNIFCINCESFEEIEVVNDLAKKLGKIAQIAIRINPNFDAHTHHYITTGVDENKFGLTIDDMQQYLPKIAGYENIKIIGIHVHIGSQITDMNVFAGLCLRVNEINQWFVKNKIKIQHLNLGGGLGVDYHSPENSIPDFEAYFNTIHQNLQKVNGEQVHFEIGRAIVANCGSLITRVIYQKNGQKKKFVIVDAGFTELIRPALYNAYHKIENLSSNEETESYDIVGPICESSDCFGKNVEMPRTKRGDILAIRTAGAYGQVMASQYNLRDLVKEYYSD